MAQKVRTPAHGGRGTRVPVVHAKPWQSCTLTWYDPALGGTNSSHGQKDPHARTASGEPYDPQAMTCAAPPKYPFGTHIEFRVGAPGGGAVTIVCKVNDRGGAIQGNHFDLARRPAQLTGIERAGRGHGQFRVTSSPVDATGQLPSGPGGSSSPLPDPNSPLGQALKSPFEAVLSVADVLRPIAEFFKLSLSLFYPATWLRIGKAVIGFMLIMWGVHALLKSSFGIDVVAKAKRAAVKTAEVAALAPK